MRQFSILLLTFLLFVKPGFAEDTRVLDDLKGIVITPSSTYHVKKAALHHVTIENVGLTSKQEKKLGTELAKNYLGKPLEKETISEIKKDITSFYIGIGLPLVTVHVPQQELTAGVLHIRVTVSKVGKITISGNKYIDTETIRKNINLSRGQPVRSDVLVSDLAWLNRSPFCTASGIYAAGEELGTTDIDILIRDRRKFRAFAGVNNTGFSETRTGRVFAGFQTPIPFFNNINSQFSYQFTMSTQFTRFNAHTANLTIPMPWRHLILLYGGYSRVRNPNLDNVPENTVKIMRSKGHSIQASGRYLIPLAPFSRFVHEVEVGVDFKRTDNTLDFGGNRIVNQSVNIFQFAATYSFSARMSQFQHRFSIEAVVSPGGLLPNMSNDRFEALRTGAKHSYAYAVAKLDELIFFENEFSLLIRAQAQGTIGTLLPSEQLGLGGLYSVRGYRERVINADQGLFLSLELRLPQFQITKKTKLGFFTYIDYGLGGQQTSNNKMIGTSQLLSVGPGARLAVHEWIQATIDWGYQISHIPADRTHNRVNFSVVGSF